VRDLRRRVTIGIVAALMMLSACGGNDDATAPPTTAPEKVTTSAAPAPTTGGELPTTPGSAAIPGDTFVGLVYDAGNRTPVPGVTWRGGAVLDLDDDGDDHLFQHVLAADGRHWLWLERVVATDADGPSRVQVVAALDVTAAVERGNELLYGAQTCRLGGRSDDEIVAAARVDPEPVVVEVVEAWRANRAARQFEPVDAAAVSCETDAAGL
jgi:hypothetical protein